MSTEKMSSTIMIITKTHYVSCNHNCALRHIFVCTAWYSDECRQVQLAVTNAPTTMSNLGKLLHLEAQNWEQNLYIYIYIYEVQF